MKTNGKFSFIPNAPQLAMVHICHHGSCIWGCTADHKVYFCPGMYKEWQEVPGLALQWVTCSAGGQHVYGCTPDSKCFYRAGGIKGEWKQISGYMNRIAVSANGEHVWGVLHRDHAVFYRTGGGYSGYDNWVSVPGLKADVLSVSANGDNVWVAGPDGKLSVRTDGAKEAGEWHEAPELANAKDVCVADGGSVWAVDKENNFYQQFWQGKHRIWEKQEASKLAQLSVSQGSKILFGLDTEGKTWFYHYGE